MARCSIGPVLVVALEADRLVIVLRAQLVDGVHELRGDSLAAVVRHHAVEPGEEDRRLQLEAEEEADRPVLDAGDHLQDVVAAAEPRRNDSSSRGGRKIWLYNSTMIGISPARRCR